MNYRNSFLALAIASGLSASPAASAIDLGTYNDTSFSIGGYFKAEGIFEDPENGDSRIFGRANQTRFNLKTVTQKQGHTVVGFVEGDFYGGDYPGEDNDWRLRHAFIKIDNATVGQTWTGQFWAVAHTDYLDFLGGPRGTLAGLNFRTTLASYQTGGFRFTAQDPVNNDAEIPDLAINYNLDLEVATSSSSQPAVVKWPTAISWAAALSAPRSCWAGTASISTPTTAKASARLPGLA